MGPSTGTTTSHHSLKKDQRPPQKDSNFQGNNMSSIEVNQFTLQDQQKANSPLKKP